MVILLWLVPSVVVTVLAMAWVGWLGREGRGQVDRDEAARRIGVALEREPRVAAPARTPRERSTGVAVRRAATRPTPPARTRTPATPTVVPAATPDRPARRAS